MGRCFVTVTVLFTLSLSKSTIEDTKKLFENTIKKWNIQIKDSQDYKERYNCLVRAKARVEKTTSGVVLDSLNRFAVNNDEEQAALMAKVNQVSNLTDSSIKGPAAGINNVKSVGDGETLPDEFQYWEKELGLSDPQDQLSCGACWSFPNAAAMEALYKKLTGESVVFSKQYFIDCTFPYSGCAGGTVNMGYKLTTMRQYLMSEEDWPTTADYQPCKFGPQIALGEKNAMRKAWLQDWYPLGKDEGSMLRGLLSSPVAFGSYISLNYYSYSGGLYDDAQCGMEALSHAQLLVGYTKDYMRVRGSYGMVWGDYGYINYKRGSDNLKSCNFFNNAIAISMTLSRDIEYEFCNEAKLATRAECLKSCLAMNKKGETGWNLATIPTRKHNDEVVRMVNARYPGVKSDDKFNLLWTGLNDPEQLNQWKWSHSYHDVNYFNHTSKTGSGKFGLVNKNTGGWIMKNSQTFTARGLCSRARTCWDISTAIERGKVKFSTKDVENLVEGTTAKVSCDKKCKLKPNKKAAKLTCRGGRWNGDDELPTCQCKKKKKDKKKKEDGGV